MTKIFDRVKETCIVTGTGNITVTGAEDSSFFAYSDKYTDGEIVPYLVIEKGTSFEIGSGAFTLATGLIERTAARVTESSNSGGLVVFGAGAKVCGAANSASEIKGVNRIASGALPTGEPVIINADGTVSVGEVVSTISTALDIDAATNVNTHDHASIKIGSTIVITYSDTSFGWVIAGNISGEIITFGSPVELNFSGNAIREAMHKDITYNTITSRVIIAFIGNDAFNVYRVHLASFSLAGTVVNLVNNNIIESDAIISSPVACVYNSVEDMVIVSFETPFGLRLAAANTNEALIDGTNIEFTANGSNYHSLSYDSSSNTMVISYTKVTGSLGLRAAAFTYDVAGGTFTAGSSVSLTTTYQNSLSPIVIIPAGFFMVYLDNSSDVTSILLTVAAVTITLGSPTFIEAASMVVTDLIYDGVEAHVLLATSSLVKVVFNILSAVPPHDFVSIITDNFTGSLWLESTSIMGVTFADPANSNKSFYSIVTLASNLTDDNYLGYCQNNPTDGQTANIAVAGDIDANQTGLTASKKYYFASDGLLTTAPTGIYAGKALSATELLIGG